MMGKLFPYSGRGPNTLAEFLTLRPDLVDMYVYDLALSSGEMLYSCAGGVGATKERYISKMHSFLRMSKSTSVIREVYDTWFPSGPSKTKYYLLREHVNQTRNKMGSLVSRAEMFLLWQLSSFSHRYSGSSYEGQYKPGSFNHEALDQIRASTKLVTYRYEDWRSFSWFLISDNTFLYMYLPPVFGEFGSGFIWNQQLLEEFVVRIKSLSNYYKICVCTQTTSRGGVLNSNIELLSFLPKFYNVRFKDQLHSSDSYLLNF